MSTEQSNALQHIIDMPLDEVLSEKYLSYALSTIMSRSLPDVRDGLKPVHRRLLFAMRQLNLKSSGMPKKSARVVGDVIGKYHPHGDTAVYDAMVRLAQDFAVRYPLVFGQGNFGNIDGDGAAAMRYTEAKLTTVAEALLEDLDSDTVDFRYTYDGESEEPIVLPAAFPNLLANGAMGIAVGMATNIPPHNVGELCDALIKLIGKKSITVAELTEYIQGPDLPTGGTIVDKREDIIRAYETGRGSFRVRAKWHTEDKGQGTYQIIVTEIPYQVQKSALIEKIANLLNEKKLPLLEDVADESAEDVRIVLTPRSRNVQPEILMETLYRACDLESRISLNMNVLDGGVVPKVMNLKQVLQAFLNHRHEVLLRKSKYRLDKIDARLEILEGLLIAYLNLDEVIRIIRHEDEPKPTLMKKFKLSDIQAESILNMRLRNLRKLEEMEIKRERKDLKEEKKALEELLENEDLRWKVIKDQIKETKKTFADKRRTELAEAVIVNEVPLEAMIEKEPLTVLISEQGWVRALKGTVQDVSDQKYKDGDRQKFVIYADTTDKLLIMGTNGKFYTVGCDGLPRGRGFGEPLRLTAGIAAEDDFTAILKYQKGAKLLLGSDDGHGFVVSQDDTVASTKNGKQIMSVPTGVEANICRVIEDGHDHVASIGMNRKLLVFPLSEVPVLQKGRGVILQRFKDGTLSDAVTFKLADGLTWQLTNGNNRTETALTEWIGRRAGSGRLPPHGFPRTNKF